MKRQVAVIAGAVACVFALQARAFAMDAKGISRVSAADQEVLDVALTNLLADQGKDSPLALRWSKTVPMAADSADWLTTVEQILQQCKKDAQLPPSELSRMKEAAQNIVSRVAHKSGFTGFRSTVAGVTAYKAPPIEKPGLEDGPIWAWPPGFSKDNSLALVRFTISWSIHSADATYVLVRGPGGWRLVMQDLCVYV